MTFRTAEQVFSNRLMGCKTVCVEVKIAALQVKNAQIKTLNAFFFAAFVVLALSIALARQAASSQNSRAS